MGLRGLEDHLDLLVCQVKDGQVARAHLVDLVTQGHRGGPGIQGPQDQLASLDTVMQTPVWDTTWEFNRIIGMTTEEHS